MTTVKSDYTYQLQREISAGVYEVFGEKVGFTIPKATKGALQVTHAGSGGWQEFIPSALKDGGEFEVTLNLVTTASGLIYDFENDYIRAYKIVSPGSIFVMDFDAFVTSIDAGEVDYTNDKPVHLTVGFRVTGDVTWSGSAT